MHPSARALLAGIIDYAGMFPPARLPLEEALQRYREHRRHRDGWLLACFVCPASRLDELGRLLARLDTAEPVVPVAVLGRGGETTTDFCSATAADLEAAGWFLEAAGGRARLDQLEVRLPAAATAAELDEAVSEALRRTRDLGDPPPTAYFEAPLLGAWRERLPAAVAAVRHGRWKDGSAGLKIRCGGADAAAVPAVDAVAAAVAACRDADLPLKATQGLHHPFRHFDPPLGASAHGFANLFLAGLLARRHHLDAARLAAVIGDQDETAFEFSEDEVRWRELALDVAAIAEGRRCAVTSFGSCSFAEPRDHLRAMGLLDG